jgi:hypothetical protein
VAGIVGTAVAVRERYRQVGLVACLGVISVVGDDGCPSRGTSIWDSTAPATSGSQGIFTCAISLANASAEPRLCLLTTAGGDQ